MSHTEMNWSEEGLGIEFSAARPSLLALAYRMLGDLGRAEDIVQDAWVRATPHCREIRHPKSYFIQTVTRLCLNELASARARREEARADRLPEPVDVDQRGLGIIDSLDRISMAFIVLLQRLSPAERAVLLLHEVFDFDHAEIATLVDKTPAACRQLLRRARDQVTQQRRSLRVEKHEHRRLLLAFLEAATRGDVSRLSKLLADDVVLIADGGAEGSRYGRVRNLPGPITGSRRVAAFLAAVTAQGSDGLEIRERELNGEPAVVVFKAGAPYTAITLDVSDGAIAGIFVHADTSRLVRLH
ncbi:MAG: sigma-70 family RNA polymerase sigma factor [Myxococcales bacterium FL481]|nr:MAG: sigma-70 family RNA polymerase sigma factor [Myxococcales bacterium FL481]